MGRPQLIHGAMEGIAMSNWRKQRGLVGTGRKSIALGGKMTEAEVKAAEEACDHVVSGAWDEYDMVWLEAAHDKVRRIALIEDLLTANDEERRETRQGHEPADAVQLGDAEIGGRLQSHDTAGAEARRVVTEAMQVVEAVPPVGSGVSQRGRPSR